MGLSWGLSLKFLKGASGESKGSRRYDKENLLWQFTSAGYTVVSGPRTTGDGCYESCIVAVEGNQIELTI